MGNNKTVQWTVLVNITPEDDRLEPEYLRTLKALLNLYGYHIYFGKDDKMEEFLNYYFEKIQ